MDDTLTSLQNYTSLLLAEKERLRQTSPDLTEDLLNAAAKLYADKLHLYNLTVDKLGIDTGVNLDQDPTVENKDSNKSEISSKAYNIIASATSGVASALGGYNAGLSAGAAFQIGSDAEMMGTGIGKAALGTNIAASAANILDLQLMGDKNFEALSKAIDSAVHSTSAALILSGNPYAMCCCAGTIIYTNSGEAKKIENLVKEDGILGYFNKECIKLPIEELFPPTYKECIQIETENGNTLRCSIDHPIYSAPEGRAKYFTVDKKKLRRIKLFSFKNADELKVGDFVAEIGHIPFFGTKHVKLAYLIGLLIGDGTYGKRRSPRLFTGDPCTWKYIEDNNLGKVTEIYLPGERYSKEFRVYTCYGINSLLRELGIYGQTKKNKRLPINIHEWNKESCAALISGLFDTDGFASCNSKQHAGISFSQSNIELIQLLKSLLLKFGIHGTISKLQAKTRYIKGRRVFSKESYVLNIKTRESVINFYNNISFNIDYKLERLQKAYLLKLNTKSRDTSLEFYNVVADKIKNIVKLGNLPVYNLCAGISHTYIADNIVTHNTAGAALEGANFLTKAGGLTVLGYDVDINSSGYGTLGHMESRSSRDFGSLLGLGGLNIAANNRKLADRNEKAAMALRAADIAEDLRFEQLARINSQENVLLANRIALAGGLDTSVLAAKQGAKLQIQLPDIEPIHDFVIIDTITKAQNGAKLENVKVSEDPSVIPSGALHKNKHDDFDLDVTKKGIPVITVEDDNVSTLEEILELADSVVLHAEVEESEVILNKSLTDYVEEARKKWHESGKKDNSICLKVGMRLAKELIENTNDNTNLIDKLNNA